MDKKKLFTILLILYIIALVFLSISPTLGNHKIVKVYDKAIHLTEFFLFAVILYKTLSYYKVRNQSFIVISTTLILIACSEAVQLYIPSRTPSLGDIGANMMGLALAVISKWIYSNQ